MASSSQLQYTASEVIPMPQLGALGAYHPQVVHFVVALAALGVLLRLVSLSGRIAWSGPAAATLILVAAFAAVVAVKSGQDAHGPAERVPGARDAVVEHEWSGEWARNALLTLATLELLALVLARFGRQRPVLLAAGAVGLVSLAVLYRTAEQGGELVYSYAGGVGLRRGEPADVGRLLLAGLYHQAQLDRKAGRAEEAAALIELAARRFPTDVEILLLAAESQLVDHKDAPATLAALARLEVPGDKPRLRLRHSFLLADALVASGQKDAARAALQSLRSQFPNDARLKKRLDDLGGS
jgi:uncharacterized membrane protein